MNKGLWTYKIIQNRKRKREYQQKNDLEEFTSQQFKRSMNNRRYGGRLGQP